MTSLQATDFPAFFKAVNGYTPHNWQTRLAAQVLEYGKWPQTLDLPTGVGKTAVLDIAIFAHAYDPARHARRIVFVVDRRLIVDQVAERADTLREAICGGPDTVDFEPADPILSRVAEALKPKDSHDKRPTIGTSTLRGGLNDTEWAKRPDCPWIISSTVDQVGSRLLFRGYGVSDRMLSIHAGLLGNDTLFLLDEVHISQPFRETIEALKSGRANPELERPWGVVRMSATPDESDNQAFTLDLARATQNRSTKVQTIVGANKPTTLKKVGAKRAEPATALASAVPDLVKELGDVDSIGIVVNRVASAVAITKALEKAGYKPALLTGRMRPGDRVALVDDNPAFKAVQANDNDETRATPTTKPAIVVATQTIEVGADLDFGAMITEVAPLDSLRQRFGRVDRRGKRSENGSPAPVIIVGIESMVGPKKPPFDPVYGEAAFHTWHWLSTRHGDATFDVGIEAGALERETGLLADETFDLCRLPPAHAPVLLESHKNALVQTMPRPVTEPIISRFLHGLDNEDTDVSVVWRNDVKPFLDNLQEELPASQSYLSSYFGAVPPDSSEMMPVPIRALSKWLRDGVVTDVADINTTAEQDKPKRKPSRDLKRSIREVLRWTRQGGAERIRTGDIRPGDVIVIPARWGGIASGTWAPQSVQKTAPEAATDLGGTASSRHRHLRIGPEATQDQAKEFGDDSDHATRLVAMLALLSGKTIKPATGDWDLASSTPAELRLRSYTGANGELWFVLEEQTAKASTQFDGSDDNSMTQTAALLGDHLNGVGELAALFGKQCGLSPDMVADLDLAGRMHDLGKLDPRFQLMLRDYDVIETRRSPEPLAKSSPTSSGGSFGALLREQDRYPSGLRHELLSLAMIRTQPDLVAGAHDPELVAHLVASHHGHCRPFAPVQIDPAPAVVQGSVNGTTFDTTTSLPAELVDARSAERFWTLNERYGPYGLAWLEAIFRLADHRRSEYESSLSSKRSAARSGDSK